MATWARDTVRAGLRQPISWGILGLGLLLGWCALHLGILELGEDPSRAPQLAAATAQVVGALVLLATAGALADRDAESGLARAAGATRPGPRGRCAGRWLGTLALAVGAAAVTQALMMALGRAPLGPGSLWLYLTTIAPLGLLAAWLALLATLGDGGMVVGGGLLLWLLGHLPWPLLEGPLAAVPAGLLPGPVAVADPATVAALGLASAGLLALALARRG